MSENGSLSLEALRDALIYALEKNPHSHGAEVMFVRDVKANPHLLPARLERSKTVLNHLGSERKVLADVGSGNCVNSVLAIMNGAGEVHAIELEAPRFRTGKLVVEKLGLQDRIHLHHVDVLKADLPENSLDGAFSAEFLEHISDLQGFYRTLQKWLKPGKSFYARTGANGRSWEKRRTFPATWTACDEVYLSWREEIIRKVLPDVDAVALRTLRDHTCGLLEGEIQAAAREYKASGKFPADPRPCPPRDPYTGQFMERLLDPFEVAKEIDAVGYKTTVLRPDFNSLTLPSAGKRLAFRVAGELIRLTHPLSLCVAPWLELLSENRKRA